MNKWIFVFVWILTWRAEWTVLKFCPGFYDEVRGEDRLPSEKERCVRTVFNWRHKAFDTILELENFRDHELMLSSGTTVTDISWYEYLEAKSHHEKT